MSRLQDLLNAVWDKEHEALKARYPDYTVFVKEYDFKRLFFLDIMRAVSAFEKQLESEKRTYSKQDVEYAVKKERKRVIAAFESAIEDTKDDLLHKR